MIELGQKTFLIAAAALLSATTAAGTEAKILLDDTRVRAIFVDIPAGGVYETRADATKGAVWIAVDPLELTGDTAARTVRSGDTGRLYPGAKVKFRNSASQPAKLTFIDIKSATQQLTIQTSDLGPGQTLEEASAANDTLVVAVTALRLRDVWNLAKEDDWMPSKPTVVALTPGYAQWVREGEHHLSNLLPTPARFVTIEW